MISPITQTLDDNDLDDDALWAAIDSAAATSSSALTATKSLKPQSTKNSFKSPKITFPIISSPSSTTTTTTPTRKHSLVTDNNVSPVAKKVCGYERGCYPLAMVSTPKTMVTYGSGYEIRNPGVDVVDNSDCSVMMSQHSLSGRFPTVAVFKEYQNAAMASEKACLFVEVVKMKEHRRRRWYKSLKYEKDSKE
ncbi:hypothetical protein Tco_0742136 [Tanacetum coccineum]